MQENVALFPLLTTPRMLLQVSAKIERTPTVTNLCVFDSVSKPYLCSHLKMYFKEQEMELGLSLNCTHKDGQPGSSPQVKPKKLGRPLVAGVSTGASPNLKSQYLSCKSFS